MPDTKWRPGVFLHQNRDRLLHYHTTLGVPACDLHHEVTQFLKTRNPTARISAAYLRSTLAKWKKEMKEAARTKPPAGKPGTGYGDSRTSPTGTGLARIGRTPTDEERRRLIGQ